MYIYIYINTCNGESRRCSIRDSWSCGFLLRGLAANDTNTNNNTNTNTTNDNSNNANYNSTYWANNSMSEVRE